MYKFKIKEILGERGMTQVELAEAIGLSRPALYKIISGRVFPKPETIKKIADALEVHPASLIKWESDRPSPKEKAEEALRREVSIIVRTMAEKAPEMRLAVGMALVDALLNRGEHRNISDEELKDLVLFSIEMVAKARFTNPPD